MRFFADLHVHSRYSRATSRNLTVQSLALGAELKGIRVLGSGDFTHPAWLEELENELEEAEPGLYRLSSRPSPVRFLLTAEISTIYKDAGRVRKVHHVLGAPDFVSARNIAQALAKRGNITSDGRPILGITSRELLEIVLEAGADTFLIPAHIWTPWFSALGSRSGYDSIAECYHDLSPHIFAVETGLSSDPPMNWRVSSLDAYHMISNSDAHSAAKLGREATLFDLPLDYYAMLEAMRTGEGLLGTVEFFPEEGKYHLDGHRDCGVVFTPQETAAHGGLCPVCGRPLTVGVLNRVEALADRPEGRRSPTARDFWSLTPLAELLSEIMGVGPASKRVQAAYGPLVEMFGGELPLLLDVDPGEIRHRGFETLAEAVCRMRAGEVHKDAGYDGRFGRIRVFMDAHRDLLFDCAAAPRASRNDVKPQKPAQQRPKKKDFCLNEDQQRAVDHDAGALMVIAGPGTGKTRVLVERMRVFNERGAGAMLAITFTTRACGEIRERLGDIPADVHTFHALAARMLREHGVAFHVADDGDLLAEAEARGMDDAAERVAELLLNQSLMHALDDEQQSLVDALRDRDVYTYEGLVERAMELPGLVAPAWEHVLVDEFQDINPLQYAFVRWLCRGAASVMVIGDPHQAIYGFRGATPRAFDDFARDFKPVENISLRETYRLSTVVARASNAFIGEEKVQSPREGESIHRISCAWPYDYLAEQIETLAGGLSHRTTGRTAVEYALADMAVIVRTRQQARPVQEALERAGIPHESAYAVPVSNRGGVWQRLQLLTRDDWEQHVRGVGEKTLAQWRAGESVSFAARENLHRAGKLLDDLDGPVAQRVRNIEAAELFKLPELAADHPFYRDMPLFGDDLAGFVAHLKLTQDEAGLPLQGVRVLTAHAAKGLEFGVVFVIGLPLFPMVGMPPEEERNLFYVTMTRAKERLYLVHGPEQECAFADMLPGELVQFERQTFTPRVRQLTLF